MEMQTYRFEFGTTEADAFEGNVAEEDGAFYLVVRDTSSDQPEIGLRFDSREAAWSCIETWLHAMLLREER